MVFRTVNGVGIEVDCDVYHSLAKKKLKFRAKPEKPAYALVRNHGRKCYDKFFIHRYVLNAGNKKVFFRDGNPHNCLRSNLYTRGNPEIYIPRSKKEYFTGPLSSLSDLEVIHNYQIDGKEVFFNEIVKRYNRLIRTFTRIITANIPITRLGLEYNDIYVEMLVKTQSSMSYIDQSKIKDIGNFKFSTFLYQNYKKISSSLRSKIRQFNKIEYMEDNEDYFSFLSGKEIRDRRNMFIDMEGKIIEKFYKSISGTILTRDGTHISERKFFEKLLSDNSVKKIEKMLNIKNGNYHKHKLKNEFKNFIKNDVIFSY